MFFSTCPNCRCEISRQLCCRSLVAEKGMKERIKRKASHFNCKII